MNSIRLRVYIKPSGRAGSRDENMPEQYVLEISPDLAAMARIPVIARVIAGLAKKSRMKTILIYKICNLKLNLSLPFGGGAALFL
jgi:hypothetical protein